MCHLWVVSLFPKSGKIRIIIDARKTNQLLRPPPSTTLASTAAVAEFESEEAELHFSIQDIADCFYQFAIDERLQKYFALMPVKAGELGIHEIEGKKVAYDRMIYPCLSVLPMGFSWALHWTQQAHRHLLELGGFGNSSSELLDKHPPPQLDKDKPAKLIYVDNELFFLVLDKKP